MAKVYSPAPVPRTPKTLARIRPCPAHAFGQGDAPGLRGADVDRIVREHAVDRLDHKHLNTDVPDFRDINPSVERIAEVCHGWLAAPLRAAGGELLRVRLWETEKTSAVYPG